MTIMQIPTFKTLAEAGQYWARHEDIVVPMAEYAIKHKIVTVDGSEPDADAVMAFGAGILQHYESVWYKPKYYKIVSESDGKIEYLPKPTKDSSYITVSYAVGLTPPDLAKVIGHRDHPDTLKGLVTTVRDGALKYKRQRLDRLQKAALVKKDRNPPDTCVVMVDKLLTRIGKRAIKEGYITAAEFKILAKTVVNKLFAATQKNLNS